MREQRPNRCCSNYPPGIMIRCAISTTASKSCRCPESRAPRPPLLGPSPASALGCVCMCVPPMCYHYRRRMRTYYSPPAFTLCMRKSLAKLCPVNWLICWQYACIWLAMSSDSRRLGAGIGLKSGLVDVSSSGLGSSPLRSRSCASIFFLSRKSDCGRGEGDGVRRVSRAMRGGESRRGAALSRGRRGGDRAARAFVCLLLLLAVEVALVLLHLVRLLLQVVDALDEQLHLLLEEGVGVELEPRKVRRRRREADLVLELEEEGRREVRVAHLERELLEDLRPRRRRRRRVARKLPLLVLGHERVGQPEGAQREAGARARDGS